MTKNDVLAHIIEKMSDGRRRLDNLRSLKDPSTLEQAAIEMCEHDLEINAILGMALLDSALSEWVPVSERKPAEKEDCLKALLCPDEYSRHPWTRSDMVLLRIEHPGGRVTVREGYTTNGVFRFECHERGDRVTHWKPMPSAKVEEEEKEWRLLTERQPSSCCESTKPRARRTASSCGQQKTG